MDIFKSSRHAKLTGDFGEALVLYWLSKYGFECARVDHTGIDLIARNPHNDELMGISVKSRCRTSGKEENEVRVPRQEFTKTSAACAAFGCQPYFALVVDAANTIRCFLLTMEHFQSLCPAGCTYAALSMRAKKLDMYRQDPLIRVFEFHTKTVRWWNNGSDTQAPSPGLDAVQTKTGGE
jgi:hypothetical protein